MSTVDEEEGGGFGRFSLYSTDTGEQVASVDRGLSRCAALLQVLLSPERPKPGEKTGNTQSVGSNKLTAGKKQAASGKAVNPRFPGAFRHAHRPLLQSHPPSSSTPIKRHSRSRTEPGEVPRNPPTVPAREDTVAATVHCRQTRRKLAKAHRRLLTEPAKPQQTKRAGITLTAAKQNTDEKPPPATSSSNTAPNTSKPATGTPVTTATGRPDGQFPVYYAPSSVYPSYYPVFPYPWTSFAPPLPPPSAISEQQQQQQQQSSAVMIQALGREMMNVFLQSLSRTKQASADAGLLRELEGMENAQRLSFERMCQLCQHLQSVPLQCGTAHHWSSQLQQGEAERQHLLEQLVKVEGDCAVSKGKLEVSGRKLEEQQHELLRRTSRIAALNRELLTLQSMLEAANRQAERSAEELKALRENSARSILNLTAKNAALQQQLEAMEAEPVKLRKELLRSRECVAAVKRSLGTAREEVGITRLSLAEKETELLQAHDKLLGFRQCLAYFISDLKKLDPQSSLEGASLCYHAPQEAVHRLQALVHDQNLEGFLAAYPSRGLDEQNDTLTACAEEEEEEEELVSCSVLVAREDDPKCPDSTDNEPEKLSSLTSGAASSSLDTATTVRQRLITPVHSSSSYQQTPSKTKTVQDPSDQSHDRSEAPPPSSAAQLGSTLTTSSEVEFRQDLATLDANIARLQTHFRIAMHTHR